MTDDVADVCEGSAKHRGKPFAKGFDPRRNLDGGPPKGETWADIYRQIGDMTPADLAKMVGGNRTELGRMINQQGKLPVSMRVLTVIKTYLQAANDPQPGILKEMADRSDGKVPDRNEIKAEINIDGFEEILKSVYGND